MPEIRFVVIHQPGPRWQAALGLMEQEGLQDHIDHYRAFLADGRLEAGGPFVDSSGGMMVARAGVPREVVQAHAEADPAVQSGLLTFTVHPWMRAMQAP